MLPSAVCQLERRIPSTIKLLAWMQRYQMKRGDLLMEILLGMLVCTVQGLIVFMEVMVML